MPGPAPQSPMYAASRHEQARAARTARTARTAKEGTPPRKSLRGFSAGLTKNRHDNYGRRCSVSARGAKSTDHGIDRRFAPRTPLHPRRLRRAPRLGPKRPWSTLVARRALDDPSEIRHYFGPVSPMAGAARSLGGRKRRWRSRRAAKPKATPARTVFAGFAAS